MRSGSLFAALLAVVRLSGALSFIVAPPATLSTLTSSRHHVSCASTPLATPGAAPAAATPLRASMNRPRTGSDSSVSARRRTRLEASGESLGEEGVVASEDAAVAPDAVAEAALVSSVGGVAAPNSGAAADLSKGIAFEAPKAKEGGVESEEESQSKKVRVILYTVLSLVPFLLLLPFLGSRELMPLDPSQM